MQLSYDYAKDRALICLRANYESHLRTCHIADAGIRDRHAANNLYGRLNGEIKDGIARVRGFKSKTPALLRLLIVYHNLVRPHSSLDGKTPAETARITIDGPDKWLTLIQQVASSCA